MERRALLVGIATSVVSTPAWGQMVLTGDGARPRPPDDPAAARFVRAQEFAAGLDLHVGGDVGDFLYHAGIVSHLGLTAYLFNRGLDDAWCRDRLGLDVAKTLAFANHLGLGCDCNRMAELAALLGPYGRWRWPHGCDLPDVSAVRPATAVIGVARLLEEVEQRIADGRFR